MKIIIAPKSGQIVFIKTPLGTKHCLVVDFIENEKMNKATIKVKGIVDSLFVTTNIEISDLKAYHSHKEVASSHGYFRILKPVIHQGNTDEVGVLIPQTHYKS